MPSPPTWTKEEPLPKVKCTDSDCERDLHSFLRVGPRNQTYRNGSCRECGIDLIDWSRLDRHDLSDVAHTIASLGRELIRHTYWHRALDQKAINHAKRKGREGLRVAAEERLRKSVGPPRSKIFRDGTQTKLHGNVLHYAQHATATCCRKCIEAWHGIPREQPLSTTEIGYMLELVMRYVDERMPYLTANGAKVPRQQKE